MTNGDDLYMRLINIRLFMFAPFALAVGGCASLGSNQAASVSDSAPAMTEQQSPLVSLYEDLAAVPLAGIADVASPDGFGAGGVRVVNRYFSASGKDCTSVDSQSTGDRRILCRDSAGIVNAIDVPKSPSGR